jgi:ABC-type transport system involved in cytochrome c biogenesis permease component
MTRGLVHHLLLTLRLNLRSKQALVYGYLVPIFFLLAFGSVFRSGSPRLMRQMGQLVTISVLGGACFGMPTSLVAERERGVWRRYRLLPAGTGALVSSTMIARFFIVASAAIMQIVLARVIYGTPWPRHPGELAIAFTFVAFAFLGVGLIIAALADNVPAVQALGQAIFLPMIMIGGVGVSLDVLPAWAQRVAGFLPGRYAVAALDSCFSTAHGIGGAGFDLLALVVIGIAACICGAKLFRWDVGEKVDRSAKWWVVAALLSWVAVGLAADFSGRLKPVSDVSQGITQEQIDAIHFDDLPADDDVVTPLAPANQQLAGPEKQRIDDFSVRLNNWPPGHVEPINQRVRNLVSAASVADILQDPLEGNIGRVVFEHLKSDVDTDQLEAALAWIVLHPEDGTVVTTAPDLGLSQNVAEDQIRDRDMLYAKKFLGKLLGKLADG